MIILLILAGLIVLGIVLDQMNRYSDWLLLSFLSSVFLAFALFAIPMNRMDVQGAVAKFHAIEQAVAVTRAKGTSIEDAALQLKIIEANQWLAGAQYWRGTTFWVFLPESVEALAPIE